MPGEMNMSKSCIFKQYLTGLKISGKGYTLYCSFININLIGVLKDILIVEDPV